MADVIVINKADGDNIKRAKLAKVEFNRALHLYPEKESKWQPKVAVCSALYNEGVSDVWDMILEYNKQTSNNNYFDFKRNEQNKYWLLQTINERLKSDFYNQPTIKKELEKQLQLIEDNTTTPFVAADYLLNL